MKREWVKEYLKRIHAEFSINPTAETLDTLIRSHIRSIPFENLDVIDFNKIPELKEEVLFEKIVQKNRGGYCFELNKLFTALLKALDYEVYSVAVRVMWNRDHIPPVSHMGLVTMIQNQKYYCDVGFGGPGPKGLLALDGTAQNIDGECFRSLITEDGDILIERLSHNVWKQVLRFTDRKVRDEDFELLNFYCAKNEKVLFTKARVVNLCIPGGSKALLNQELTIRKNGKEQTIVYQTQEELEAGLKQEFGLCVTLPNHEKGGMNPL